MLDRQLAYIAPLLRFAVTEYKVPPDRAFYSVLKGAQREKANLTPGELILYSSDFAFSCFLTIRTAQMLLHHTHVAPAFHLENPDASDGVIEDLMAQDSTLQSVSDATEGPEQKSPRCSPST